MVASTRVFASGKASAAPVPRAEIGGVRGAQGLLSEIPFVVGAVVLLTLVVMAVLAPWVAPYDPAAPVGSLIPPSLAHPLGTDQLGRDIFSRVDGGGRLFGLQPSV